MICEVMLSTSRSPQAPLKRGQQVQNYHALSDILWDLGHFDTSTVAFLHPRMLFRLRSILIRHIAIPSLVRYDSNNGRTSYERFQARLG